MAFPSNNFYSAPSGQGIYAGRFAPSALTTLIESMAPNTFAQLTTTNIREAVFNPYFNDSFSALESDPNRILTNWTNKIAFIPSKQRIVWIGTSEGYAANLDGRFRSKAVTYKLKENQFYQNWNPTDRVEGHAFDDNCSIDLNGKLYRRSFIGNQVSVYDAETELWSPLFVLSGIGTQGDTWSLEVFPELGAEGSLMLLEKFGRLFRYDLATAALTQVGTYSDIGTNCLMVYVNGALIFGAGNGGSIVVGTLYKMLPNGSVSVLTSNLPQLISVDGTINNKLLPDPRGRSLAFVFTNTDDKIRTLNTDTGEFSIIRDNEANLAGSALVAACSITGTDGIVFLRGRGRSGGVNQSEFWVYRIPA